MPSAAAGDPRSSPGEDGSPAAAEGAGRLVAALVAAAVCVGFLVPLPRYSVDARILPIAIGGPTAALALMNLLREMITRRKHRPRHTHRPDSGSDDPVMSVAAASLYILGFGAAIGLLGFLWGSLVAVVLFIRFYGGESYRLAMTYAALLTGTVYVVFVVAFGIDSYSGLVFGS